MAIIKISELPVADSPVSPSDVAPFLQNGVTKQASIDQFGFLPAGANAVTRTIQNKLRDIVNVKDFGAVGDNIVNDTAAIQSAINAVSAAGGGTIYLPAGTFRVTTTINVASNINLVGAGIGTTVIKMDSASTAAEVIYGTGLTNVRIENLSVDANGTARSGNPNVMGGVRITVSTNVVLEDMEVYGS